MPARARKKETSASSVSSKESTAKFSAKKVKEPRKKPPRCLVKLCELCITLFRVMIGLVIVFMFSIYMFYGGGGKFPENNIVGEPIFVWIIISNHNFIYKIQNSYFFKKKDSSNLEKLIDLQYPPGNVAVSEGGRVFFTLHPEGQPTYQIYGLYQQKLSNM